MSETPGTQSLLPDDQDNPAASSAGGRWGARFSSSRGLLVSIGVIVVLVVVASVMVATGGTGSPKAAPHQQPVPHTVPGGGPSVVSGLHVVDGVPVGYPDTQAGATDAASNYEVARTTPSYITSTTTRHQVLSVIMTPSSLGSEEASEDAQAQQVASSMGLTSSQADFLARGAPLGIRVDSYTPQIATVEVWMSEVVGVASASASTPPTASWSTYTMVLVWQNRDWRAQSITEVAGPTPLADSSSQPASAEQWSQITGSFGAPPAAG